MPVANEAQGHGLLDNSYLTPLCGITSTIKKINKLLFFVSLFNKART
jgi:hypothetical protein